MIFNIGRHDIAICLRSLTQRYTWLEERKKKQRRYEAKEITMQSNFRKLEAVDIRGVVMISMGDDDE
jgi:hypothetical protein